MAWLVLVGMAWAGCAERSAAAGEATAKALEKMVPQARTLEDPGPLVARVRKLVDDDGVCSTVEKVRAAFVLLEGGPDDQDVASRLAREAYEEGGDPVAGRTAARAADLAAVARGEPQPYMTLSATVAGKVCLFPWSDEVSDAHRAELGLDSVEERLYAFAEESGFRGDPSPEELAVVGRICGQDAPAEASEESAEVFVPEPDSEEDAIDPRDPSAPSSVRDGEAVRAKRATAVDAVRANKCRGARQDVRCAEPEEGQAQ